MLNFIDPKILNICSFQTGKKNGNLTPFEQGFSAFSISVKTQFDFPKSHDFQPSVCLFTLANYLLKL